MRLKETSMLCEIMEYYTNDLCGVYDYEIVSINAVDDAAVFIIKEYDPFRRPVGTSSFNVRVDMEKQTVSITCNITDCLEAMYDAYDYNEQQKHEVELHFKDIIHKYQTNMVF